MGVSMRFKIFLIGLASLIFAGTASAEGVSIDPGMWEMTSTMTMTMMPEPRSNTVQECIENDELSPESFNMDKDNPCDITEVAIEGNTARWSINCSTDGGPAMEGQWEFTSNGDSISGKGEMSAEFSGQKMGFNMTWKGKRIGNVGTWPTQPLVIVNYGGATGSEILEFSEQIRNAVDKQFGVYFDREVNVV